MSRLAFADIVEHMPTAGGPSFDASMFRRAARDSSAETAEDRAAIEQAAFERGLAEGSALAEERIAEAQAEFDAALQLAVAAERQRIVEEEGKLLGVAIADGLAEMEQRLSEKVAEVLRPLLQSAVVDRALAELVELLRKAATHDGAMLKITASPEIVASLRAQLGDQLDRLAFSEGGEGEVIVDAGGARMFVALEAWRKSISGATL